MKNGFNWGWKIALLYGSFVSFMLFMVYKASNEKVELVTKNYYEEELNYQSRIDRILFTDSMKVKPEWQVKGNEVAMLFPKKDEQESITGNIHFYCPADEKRDFNFPFTVKDQKELDIKDEKLRHGTYKMQIDWKQGKSDFYTEGVVTIQ